MEPFQGPRLKIERAKQHINELNSYVSAFGTGGYGVTAKSDPNSGNTIVQVEISHSMPEGFSLILGDSLHNLKAALDITINSVSKVSDRHTRFPVRDSRDDFKSAISPLEKKTGKAIADFIVNVIKPYKGGNDALWSLHELNIIDKHRIIIPAFQMHFVDNIRIEDDRGQSHALGTWVITAARRFVRTELIGVRNGKITNYGDPSLSVVFGEGMPFEDEAIVPTMHQLTELVSGIVDGIEKICLAERR